MMYTYTKAYLKTMIANSLNKQGETFIHVSVVYNYAQYGIPTWFKYSVTQSVFKRLNILYV